MGKDKRAIITGGNRGIGFAIAQALAEDGYDLILIARSADSLKQAQRKIQAQVPKCSVQIFEADLADRTQVSNAASFVVKYWDSASVLVNNAGSFVPGSVLTESDDALGLMLETNLYSAYYLTRDLFEMLDNGHGGHIFNLCSIASVQPYPNGGAYGISKFAMLGWSKNLREECKTRNIKVTAILPGATWTDSWKESGLSEDRFIKPEDIASVVINALHMSPAAVVEEIVIRPQTGDV